MKNIKENGRSMIEMLGVLAIIGVLSVGGIAGYSKAMHRYRINETNRIMSSVFHNFDVLTSTKYVGDGVELNTPQQMIKYGVIDAADCNENDEYVSGSGDEYAVCELPIGGLRWYFSFVRTPTGDEPNKFAGEFILDIPDAANRVELCIDFLSHDWLSVIPKRWWQPLGYISAFSTYIYGYNEEEFNSTPYSLEDVIDACGKCAEEGYCFIVFTFAHEV